MAKIFNITRLDGFPLLPGVKSITMWKLKREQDSYRSSMVGMACLSGLHFMYSCLDQDFGSRWQGKQEQNQKLNRVVHALKGFLFFVKSF